MKTGWRSKAVEKNGNRALIKRCDHGYPIVECPTCELFDLLEDAHERGLSVIIPSGRQAIN